MTATTRVLNWDTRLAQWAQHVRGQPFEWGKSDCGMLVRRGHRIMYDQDVYAQLGAWSSPRSAARVLVEHGGMAAILEAAGATKVDYHHLQSGDVILAERSGAFGLAALCCAGGILLSDEEHGVQWGETPAEAIGVSAVYRLPWEIAS